MLIPGSVGADERDFFFKFFIPDLINDQISQA